ncbi:MAG: TerC family protein [Hyphomicrobiaceae bacterium]|nr:TerC family protein [Hyphomicrobiaceae bacterium]
MLDFLAADPTSLWQALLIELDHIVSPAWWQANIDGLIKVFIIDITLAGDNAIVVGMAAAQVPKAQRGKVIFWGISAAVILRILFAAVTQKLLLIVGLTLAGGILLLYVCWKMYRQITGPEEHDLDTVQAAANGGNNNLSFWGAVTQIIIADVSMSLDNVLAVAGAAGESELVLVLGLALSIILMAVASHFIARLLVRYPWIAWIGFLIILWVALDMIYRGSHEVTCKAFEFGCSEDLLKAIMHRLGIGG